MPLSRTACLPLLGLLSLVAADAALAQPAMTVTATMAHRCIKNADWSFPGGFE